MIEFEKWHGNGNDFVIVNSIEQELKIKKSFIKKISDRNKGIGFDQLVTINTGSKKYCFKNFKSFIGDVDIFLKC